MSYWLRCLNKNHLYHDELITNAHISIDRVNRDLLDRQVCLFKFAIRLKMLYFVCVCLWIECALHVLSIHSTMILLRIVYLHHFNGRDKQWTFQVPKHHYTKPFHFINGFCSYLLSSSFMVFYELDNAQYSSQNRLIILEKCSILIKIDPFLYQWTTLYYTNLCIGMTKSLILGKVSATFESPSTHEKCRRSPSTHEKCRRTHENKSLRNLGNDEQFPRVYH